MKFLIYVSLFLMIFSIFTEIESKNTKRDEDTKRLFRRKRLPIARNSSAGTFSRSSLQYNNSPSRNSNASGMSSALSLGNLGLDLPSTKTKRHYPKEKKSTITTGVNGRGPVRGPRESPRGYVGSPRGYARGPRPYGYYRGGFPTWITSYAVIMRYVEECPSFHGSLQYVQQLDGLCLMLCDKEHCIQTLNYCCYYVEASKYVEVAAKKK